MHVLQIAWEYPPYIIGGLGRHVAELVPALAAHGVQVTVLAPRLSGGSLNETDQGIIIHRVEVPEMPRADFPGFVAHTNQLLIKAALALQPSAGRFDLIHAHDWLAADVGTVLKHHWKIPLVATIHATERGRGRGGLHSLAAHRINDLEWHLSYEAWRLIVCSHFMARQVQDYFQTPADKIDIVPNGVNIGRSPFNDAEHWLEFRRRYVADNERMVFHVGRIVFEKGLHTLLDAWPTISRRLLARLVIAGTGDYLEALKARAAALGIGSTVRFAGFITNEDRDRLYHAADLAIFPSLYEPFGIVALEALANACPLIVSDAGGLAEVVQHGITGLIVPADNPGALADAVIATLDRPEIARARAGAALNEIRDFYTWSRIAWLTFAVYRQVLNEWDTTSWGKELPMT